MLVETEISELLKKADFDEAFKLIVSSQKKAIYIHIYRHSTHFQLAIHPVDHREEQKFQGVASKSKNVLRLVYRSNF